MFIVLLKRTEDFLGAHPFSRCGTELSWTVPTMEEMVNPSRLRVMKQTVPRVMKGVL